MRLFDWLNRWSTSTGIARRKARRRNSRYHCQIAAVAMIEPLERREVLTSTVSLMSGGGALAEGNTGPSASQFFVMVMPMSPTSIVVNYSIPVGAVNAADFFGPMSGSMTIPPNTPGQPLPVRVNGDLDVELDELYALNITASGAILGISSLTGTLLNDDVGMPPPPPMNTPPTISLTPGQNLTVNEDNALGLGPLNFTVGDAETPVGSLAVSVDPTTNMVLFPTSGIIFGGAGAARTVTIPLAANKNGVGNVVLKVTDGGGASTTMTFQVTVNAVNDAPIINTAPNPPTAEGQMVMWTPTIGTDTTKDITEPDIGDTCTITSVSGLPNGVNWTATGINGRVHYDAAGVHNVTITVTDSGGLTGTKNVTWTIADRSIGTLTGTETTGSVDLANSVTVSSVTTTDLWISSPNQIRLSVQAPTGGTLPQLSDIRYKVGPAASPLTGSSTLSTPTTLMTFADNDLVRVGVDVNCDNVFDAAEVTHQFRIRRVDLTGAVIKTKRISVTGLSDTNSLDENYYEVNANEIYDNVSTYSVQLVGGTYGPTTVIRPDVYYTAVRHSTDLSANSGTTVDWTPTDVTSLGTLEFYADANNNGLWEIWESRAVSNSFIVATPRQLNFTYDVSSLLTAIAALSESDRTDAIRSYVNQSVGRLRTKDFQDDYRAAIVVNIQPLGNGLFTPNSTTQPDPATGDAEKSLNLGMIPNYHIRFLSDLGPSSIPGEEKTGFSNGTKILIDWADKVDATAAHEIGHVVGLSDGTTAPWTDLHVMWWRPTDKKKLFHSEAAAYSGF